MAAPRWGELAGVPAGRRRCSAVWERGESKGASEIDSWGSCGARALARRARRALSRAVHGDVAVAAVEEVLGAAGRVAREGEGQREATGGGGGRPRRVGASARRSNGRESREGVGGGAVGGVGGEKQSREGEEGDKGDFEISKSSRD